MELNLILESLLNYYMREKLYGKAKEIYEELKRKDEKVDEHPQLSLYNGLIELNNGNVLVARHVFESLQQYPDFLYASLVGLGHMHKTVSLTDKSSFQEVESRMRNARRNAEAVSLFHAATVFLYTGNYEKAKDSTDKILKSVDRKVSYLLMVFWIELEIGAKDYKLIGQLIEDAKFLSSNPDINLILARSEFEQYRRNYQLSIDILNQGSSEWPNFLPFYIEKVKAHFALKQWDQCAEVAEKCLVIDRNCISASIYLALHATCYGGHYNECGRNEAILQICKNFVEKAVEISNRKNSNFLAELACQYRLSSQYKQSIKLYNQAMEQEDASHDALVGLIHTQILDDNIQEAESQLQLLKTVHQVDVWDMRMVYVEILIAKAKNDPDIKSNLIDLANRQLEKVHDTPSTYEPFFTLDVDFLLEIIHNLYNFAPIEPAKNETVADPFLKEIIAILSRVLDFVPGLVEGLYLVGKARYLSADLDSALTSLQQCLSKDHTYLEAHILMAQIYLHKQQYKLASQCLELGLSFNFEVREHPIYNLIKARILKKFNKIADSVLLLESTMNLPKLKREKASTFQEDAAKLMKQALIEYKDKNEEQHLVILNADLALNRGDVERALAMLKSITPDQPNYLDARQKMADIYLHFKKDKREFAACFK
uniref:Uncharacterized protein n=1 Tax=Romanomermis culicivorax TaxID=13658 RepID=A0A915IPA3_ROMCU